MKKTDFHIYNSSFVHPLLDRLNRSGQSTESLLSKGDIKRFDVYDSKTYIPLEVVHEFLVRVQKAASVANIANTFYYDTSLSDFGDYGEFLTVCPDLLTVVLEGIKYESIFQTNTRIQLDMEGPLARLYTVMLDPPSEGRVIAEQMAFAALFRAVKMFLGESWKPISIQLASSSERDLEKLLGGEEIGVECGCADFGITIPTSLLASSNLLSMQPVRPPSIELDRFSDVIYHVLSSFADGYIPTVKDFSNYFDVSERTIIRQLVGEGTSFSSLIQRFRFTKSLDLLSHENLRISEISERLGYANTSNFLRAFKGWTNMTPEAYRHTGAYIKS